MKVHLMLCMVRPSTGSHLKIKVDKPLNNEEIAALVAKDYPGWELVEILTR